MHMKHYYSLPFLWRPIRHRKSLTKFYQIWIINPKMKNHYFRSYLRSSIGKKTHPKHFKMCQMPPFGVYDFKNHSKVTPPDPLYCKPLRGSQRACGVYDFKNYPMWHPRTPFTASPRGAHGVPAARNPQKKWKLNDSWSTIAIPFTNLGRPRVPSLSERRVKGLPPYPNLTVISKFKFKNIYTIIN